jgi:hypothetical protein
MTGPLPPSPPRQFTVAEYHDMIAAGFFAKDERFELIDGWVVPMLTRTPAHNYCLEVASDVIRPLLPRRWRLRIHSAVTTNDSEPAPDIAVVRGPARRHLYRHPCPADIAMLIEIAESTLDLDRDVKGPMYARAQIAIYWIINLIDNQVEVYADPVGGRNARYRRGKVYGSNGAVPLVIVGKQVGRVAVRDLLPS